MVFFVNDLFLFVWIQHSCLANTDLTLYPSKSVIKRLFDLVNDEHLTCLETF